jgi:phytoene dehydrogenase-like protein
VAGHAGGWPFPRGGAQRLTDALVAVLRGHGGELVLGEPVDSLDGLPASRAVLCDVSPSELVRIAGSRLPTWYVEKLARFRHGPGAFKIDWALDAPIPWSADVCRRAGVVHIGGTLEEIAEGERVVGRGGHPDRPFVLLAQPSLFDATRAPEGRHTAWAYCHVPNGSAVDLTAAIEAQVERFAPGFRGRVLARHTMTTSDFVRHNRNLVGGDFTGGANDVTQMLWRPTATAYRTPAPGLYLCSASAPPGGGVHGMCGVHAAQAVINDAAHAASKGTTLKPKG